MVERYIAPLNYIIFCSLQVMEHVDYRHPELYNSMANDTVFVTSLRHPLSRLKSHLNYLAGYYGMKNESQSEFVDQFLNKSNKTSPFISSFVDTGAKFVSVPIKFHHNPQKLEEFVEHELGELFQIVPITEHFDESLVLMRRKLCWDLKDILYFSLKPGNYTHKTKTYPTKNLQKHREMMVSYLLMHSRVFIYVCSDGSKGR